jgi:magnesium chelatase subunit D
LRAALPWQALRSSAISNDRQSTRILFEKCDLQVSRRKDRNESTTIFVVDASGSQAAQRLGEVKGAIELLIADCYVRRDQVALVAFRKRQADILLAPTRALARAKRALAELPGGGGTPLAAGVDKAALLVDAVRRQGRTPKVVFLTDGRANVSRDGTEGHANATAEALHAARSFRSNGLRPIVIDTSRRPRPAAREFAAAMAAAYVPLPQASAASINSVVAKAST